MMHRRNWNGFIHHLTIDETLDIPATDLPDGSGSPYIFETARQRGLLHFWVKATDERDRTFHLDIARETPKHHRQDGSIGPTAGTPIVEAAKPEGHVPVAEDYTIDALDEGSCPFDTVVLWNAIRRARDDYLDEWGIGEAENDRIDGYCHEHAEILLETLAPAWDGTNTAGKTRTTPYVQFGGVTSQTTTGVSAEALDTIDAVNAEGCGHYWVVAPLEGDTDSPQPPTSTDQYTVDIYGQTEGRSGEPLLIAGRVHDYRPVEGESVPAGIIRQSNLWWRDHL